MSKLLKSSCPKIFVGENELIIRVKDLVLLLSFELSAILLYSKVAFFLLSSSKTEENVPIFDYFRTHSKTY
jgi:hypothetical protein